MLRLAPSGRVTSFWASPPLTLYIESSVVNEVGNYEATGPGF